MRENIILRGLEADFCVYNELTGRSTTHMALSKSERISCAGAAGQTSTMVTFINVKLLSWNINKETEILPITFVQIKTLKLPDCLSFNPFIITDGLTLAVL